MVVTCHVNVTNCNLGKYDRLPGLITTDIRGIGRVRHLNGAKYQKQWNEAEEVRVQESDQKQLLWNENSQPVEQSIRHSCNGTKCKLFQRKIRQTECWKQI